MFDYLIDREIKRRLDPEEGDRWVPDGTLTACLAYADDTDSTRIGRTAYITGRYLIAYIAYQRAIAIRTSRGAEDLVRQPPFAN